MPDFGTVSIIMPTWNCARYISMAIKSVQAQTYRDWEIIIYDDCSTDSTEKTVQPYLEEDYRIKYYSNEVNMGAAVTRNNALKRAKGRWIAFLDSDDIWLPDKLERQLAFMVNNNYSFSYHAYSEISEEGEELGVTVRGKKTVRKFGMFSCCWPGCLTVMYDSEKIGLIQIKDVRRNNDTALWLKIIRKTSCHFLNENLARYRRRKSSITPKPLWKRIWAHYPLFRVAEEMSPACAAFWTIVNIFGNGWKKIFYVERTKTR